jgi:hypothetical protein
MEVQLLQVSDVKVDVLGLNGLTNPRVPGFAAALQNRRVTFDENENRKRSGDSGAEPDGSDGFNHEDRGENGIDIEAVVACVEGTDAVIHLVTSNHLRTMDILKSPRAPQTKK